MARDFLFRIIKSNHAAAAAEMAMVTPFLIILMFGSFELGNYFLSEHVVAKAVRDGARYAARQSFTNFTCSPRHVDDTVQQQTKNLTRTGQIADGGQSRLLGWDDTSSDPTVTVEVIRCTDNRAADYLGVYKGMNDIPTVKVSAIVPYSSLFNNLGFTSSNLNLVSESEATVQGL